MFFIAYITLAANLVADEVNQKHGFCSDYRTTNIGNGYYLKECSSKDSNTIKAISTLVSGAKELCNDFMFSYGPLTSLDLEHSVQRQEAQKYIPIGDRTTRIYPKAGYFDINNDGVNEYIGWLQLHSGAGRGCDIEIFAELDDQLSHIKNSTTSELLRDFSCGKSHRAFEFKGKTYIETRRYLAPFGKYSRVYKTLYEVYVIEGDTKNPVCSFATRLTNGS